MMESGSAPRPDLVFERRAGSLAEMERFPFDWANILSDKKFFHTSGVTAGLSPHTTAEVSRAMQASHSAGVAVSYDFNYRRTLWSIEEAVRRQKALLPHVDVLFCGPTELELFFGVKPGGDPAAVFDQTRAHTLVMGWRSQDEVHYGVDVVTAKGQFSSRRHLVHNIDRIGVGDAMTAGFLAALVAGADTQSAAELAAAAGALKYSIKGDMALLKRHELDDLLKGYRAVVR
jgi:2-dehydro-3-deoxygluconokinase